MQLWDTVEFSKNVFLKNLFFVSLRCISFFESILRQKSSFSLEPQLPVLGSNQNAPNRAKMTKIFLKGAGPAWLGGAKSHLVWVCCIIKINRFFNFYFFYHDIHVLDENFFGYNF